MRFNAHPELADSHALLSPSSYHWLRYDDEKFDRWYVTRLAAARGTRLHEFAAKAIELGIHLPNTKATLNRFVNDSIRWGMEPEVTLYADDMFFGHADAAGFKKNVFRVSDLKTGDSPTSMDQLKCYVALFAIEFDMNPFEFDAEMRIYQHNDVREELANPHDIMIIIDRWKTFSKRAADIRREALQ